jgi:Protein of unknown function (DUF3179)
LEVYPFLLTQRGWWSKQHPDTLVLKPMLGFAEHMAQMNAIISQRWSAVVTDARLAPKGAFGNDDRLKPREIILGLQLKEGEKAYPLTALRKELVINDTTARTPVMVVHQAVSDTTTAFDARHNGKTLKFQAADEEADRLVDVETHSFWNAYGLCVSGKLKGSRLKALVLEPEFWFAWSEFHPKTEV